MARTRHRPGQRKPRRRPRILIPLASMGDIAFLLIIFFILASEVARDVPVQAEIPRSPYVEQLDPYPITVAIDDQGRMFVAGQSVTDAGEIEIILQSLLATAVDPSQRTVFFKCDAGVDRLIYEPVLRAIAQAGARIALEGRLPETPPTSP